MKSEQLRGFELALVTDAGGGGVSSSPIAASTAGRRLRHRNGRAGKGRVGKEPEDERRVDAAVRRRLLVWEELPLWQRE
ncbi:hypothetical protein MAPG_09618 [Magnaporthiopsis poae ATCC 64411]|uniref:Uncharacterized protein n=1 Tax=Magnaporthiopsis poae (strain ATCC 64411 / 73-15) TaxID=644358 RepID=A0A0C4EAE8_MAGP6|nr:hypothetical protein MAPG_09618 [Magnaporthiopsis poae ATCC 64411]